ncbi:MAG: PDZ domain-containing protein [Patescibacteria group bacterium]|jgi:hypothetical protein
MSRNYKITILIITIIVSLAGGVIGGIIFRSYLINSSFGIPLWGDINLSDNYQQGQIVISQPKKVIVEQNDRIAEVASGAIRNKVSFYIKKQPVLSNQGGVFNIKEYYLPGDKAGEGLVLTNDGWAVTAVKVSKPLSYIAVDSEKDIIAIERSYFDEVSGYYFVKLNASDLSVAQFTEPESMRIGQLAVAFSEGGIKTAYIEKINYYPDYNLVKSSENDFSYLKISEENLALGDICFGLDGSAVGLYAKEEALMPINYFKKLLPNLLNKGEITRSYLGINYILLDELTGEEKLSGAIIAKDSIGVSIEKKSPAEAAGLLEGDIILEIEGRKISETNNLSDIILGYKTGEEIEIKIERRGEERQIKVVLGGQ